MSLHPNGACETSELHNAFKSHASAASVWLKRAINIKISTCPVDPWASGAVPIFSVAALPWHEPLAINGLVVTRRGPEVNMPWQQTSHASHRKTNDRFVIRKSNYKLWWQNTLKQRFRRSYLALINDDSVNGMLQHHFGSSRKLRSEREATLQLPLLEAYNGVSVYVLMKNEDYQSWFE